MPRRPRLDIAGVPQHVLQQCPHDKPLFRSDADYGRYLDDLRASADRYGCAVHAYALLPQRVHLLVTGPELGAVAHMMQSLGRRQAAYANARDGSRGARWAGRYRSCPVGGRDQVLTSCRYIEQSPVQARLARDVADWRWTSYACNARGHVDPCVTSHAAYRMLGPDAAARRARYRALCAESVDAQEAAALLMHIRQGRVWGSVGFLAKIAALIGRYVAARPRGRPRKKKPVTRLPPLATLSPFLLTGGMGAVQTLCRVT